MTNKFKIIMENVVRPFMDNKPAVYLLLLVAIAGGGYTATDLFERMYPDEPPVALPESVMAPVPTPKPEPRPIPQTQIIREIIKQPADCQPLIDRSLNKHEKKKHG